MPFDAVALVLFQNNSTKNPTVRVLWCSKFFSHLRGEIWHFSYVSLQFNEGIAIMKLEVSRSMKWLYCLTLIAAIFPTGVFGASGWMGLVTGGGLLQGGFIFVIPLLLIVGYRVFLVTRKPHTLDSCITGKGIKALRVMGIVLMVIGMVASIGILFLKPLTLGIFGTPGDAGIAFFAMGMWLYFFSSAGLYGLLLFEASRLLGFETQSVES